ncbi:MAG TPA: right-handed parallel beta-helix repeat-containing protein [Polyangiaceae bacterium]|jgi:hypothetical protein
MKMPSLRVSLALLAGACAPLVAPACINSDNNGPSPDAGNLALPDGGGAFDTGATGLDAALDAAPTATDASDGGGGDAVESGTPDAGNDAGAGDSGTDSSTNDAGTDAAPALGTTYYVDPVNGLDTNSGLAANAAFKAIAKAEQTIDALDAGAGPFQIKLAAGTYSAANQTAMEIFFHNPVALVAPAAGGAVFLGQGPAGAQEGLIFEGGGSVQNLALKDTWYGLEGMAGSFNVAGCSFDGAGQGGYFVAFVGNTVGTLDTTAPTATITNVVASSLGGLYVDGTAKVTWYGGGSTNVTTTTNDSLVFMRGGAQLTINRVNVTNWAGYVVVGYDQVTVTVEGSTITGSGFPTGGAGPGEGGAIWLGGSQTGAPSPSLTLTNTSITGSKGSAVFVGTAPNTAAVNLTVTSSHLDGNSSGGVWVQGGTNPALAVNINVTSSTFDNNGFFGINSLRATATFAGTGNSVSGNGATATANGYTPGGILLTDAASTNAITMRSAAVGGNTGNQISLTGTGASNLDLGTSASAGGVTFSGVAAGKTAVNLGAAIDGTAVGDTWLASTQGADSAGHFPASTTLSGPVSGQNATLVTGATLDVSP